jgi:drug/metabolite transporter (DMT)-like permease
MLVSLSGISLYFLPVIILPRQVIGIVTAIVGTSAYAFSAILGRRINRSRAFSPLVVTTISMGFGAVLLLAVGLLLEDFPVLNWQHWAMIL